MDEKTTSRTSLLKFMLLKAWRERWTDSQWGINIKTVLPRGVSGDVYNLADCILQQAVVGSDANKLVLSYLRHSLCSHLISHAAVLKRVSKYDGFEKVYCMIALLEFLESIMSGVTCRGKPEESALGNAMLSIIYWLSQAYVTALEIHRENGNLNYEEKEMCERAANVLDKIINTKFLMGVIYVAKHEDRDLFTKINKSYLEIKNTILNTGFQSTTVSTTGGGGGGSNSSSSSNNKCFEELLKKIAYLDITQLDAISMQINDTSNTNVEPIAYCLQPLIAVEVQLNPNIDTQIFVSKLLMIHRLKNYTMPRLYCEIIRACLISLYNVSGSARESMWCAFTFIKVPHILKKLNTMSKDYDEKFDYAPDVIAAFELLVEDPILDFMDTKCACNTIEFLLNELAKQHLVTEKHIKHFSLKRDSITTALSKIDINNQQPSIIKYVIRAEPPLAGILKALSADYNKMQEPLLGMLCQVLTGNSLELILSVATVEGKLKTFVTRLINCNESSKQVPGETGKQALVRSSLFDVSFLMLTFIVQAYGSDVVLDERGSSFFEKWVRDCMIERNKNKSPMNMVHLCEYAKVDELLVQLNSTENNSGAGGANNGGGSGGTSTNVAGLKNSSLKWQDICMNIPGMLYHVLLAWENETISATEVKTILDNIKVRLCAYSVCAASWLCSYMQVVRDDELLKPMNMVQQFLTALTPEEMAQQENFKERLGLSFQIIRKMQHDIHPAPNQKMRALMLQQNLVSQQPLEEQFIDCWKTVCIRGWLPIESTQIFENLLQSCGPFWFVSKLVNEMTQCKYVKDMLKTMDIVFALMHLDIERCTIALLNESLPMLLLNKLQKTKIIEPQSVVLARLCVYCILATLELPNTNAIKKRPHSNENEELENLAPLLKTRKLNNEDSSSSDYVFENLSNTREQQQQQQSQSIIIRESIQQCLQQLFKTFGQFLMADDLTPKIYFIFHFLTLLVQCGRDRIKPILKFLPTGLVQNLLKIVATDELSVGFILKVHDLSTVSERQSCLSDLCLLRNIQLRKESIHL